MAIGNIFIILNEVIFICRYGNKGAPLGGGDKSQNSITNFFRKSTRNLANSNKNSGPLNSKPEHVVLKSSTAKRIAYTVDDLQPITISELVRKGQYYK